MPPLVPQLRRKVAHWRDGGYVGATDTSVSLLLVYRPREVKLSIVVKHPVLPDQASRGKLAERQGAKYTERYADSLDLGVVEWQKTYAEHAKVGKKAILFVMTDDTRNCDDVVSYGKNYLAVSFRLDYATSTGDLSKYKPKSFGDIVNRFTKFQMEAS